MDEGVDGQGAGEVAGGRRRCAATWSACFGTGRQRHGHEEAALAVGAFGAAGSRWFRERGGMATFMRERPSGKYLSFEEREEIAVLRAQGIDHRRRLTPDSRLHVSRGRSKTFDKTGAL